MDNKNEIELTEEIIESMVYTIRDQKVMLDFDLARIYGYETKRFNEQVKRNIEKFPNDFMFSLTNVEVEMILRSQIVTAPDDLRCQNVTTNSNLRSQIATANELSSKRRYNPYAFTEQGIYMLMTVLKGELAIKQSKALIRLFKKMKDYIVESNNLLSVNGIIELTNQVNENTKRLDEHDKKIEIVMDNFIDPSTYKEFLILNGQKLEADIAYQSIYKLAKKSILIVDDYIDVKTLYLLREAKENIDVIIFTDNMSKNVLTKEFIDDFMNETHINLELYRTDNRCHDRFIFLDYDSDDEKVFLCGSSSKDAGNKITTITRLTSTHLFHNVVHALNSPKISLKL